MKHFANLFYELDQTNKTNEKVEAIVRYFQQVNDEDKVYMLGLFTGRRPKRIVNSTQLRTWAAELANIPTWLFDESYSIVGDLSETIALLIPENHTNQNQKTLGYWINYVESLAKKNEEERKAAMESAWLQLNRQERFVFNKLTSSGFRIGVSQKLVVKALSIHTGIPANIIAHRLMGKWDMHNISFHDLILSEEAQQDISKPYPFFLAYPVENEIHNLGAAEEWVAEWKWDGIRSQIIQRSGQIFIWSRGEELITDRFPELEGLKHLLPDGTVIDGEILPYKDDKVLPFQMLQKRIGRKNLTPKILKEIPVVIFAYDLLEWEGKDIREMPLVERQAILSKLIKEVHFKPYLQLAPSVEFKDWEDLSELRTQSRSFSAEGFMLKRKQSSYQTGRRKGDWWKWKVDPFTADAVLIYAQRGSGRRSNLYTDYTFGIWNNGQLSTFAKAYSGLTDKEITELDKWIRNNTLDKFGPVRTVKPEMVFELGFEGISESNRHKSGIAVRFPRILRWRKDKQIKEADSIETLKGLLEKEE